MSQVQTNQGKAAPIPPKTAPTAAPANATNATPAPDPEAAKAEADRKSRQTALDPIRGKVMAELRTVRDAYKRISDLFSTVQHAGEKERGTNLFLKHSERASEQLGWYDPKAKQLAKKAKLEQLLAKLEAEMAEEANTPPAKK